MATKSLIRRNELFPTVFDEFMRPWNDWLDNGFWGKSLTMPAANITENKDEYLLSLAVPGMKKEDFNIDVNGSLITISCEKEEKKEDKETNYTRKEYNYSSFSRSFTLPEEVNKEKIIAQYDNGLLKLIMPKKEEAKKMDTSKHISVK